MTGSALAGLLAAIGAGSAPAAQVQLSTGVEYASGDYGEATTTRTFAVPFAARVSFGRLSLRAAIPYVRVRGPADVTVVIEDGGDSRSSSGDDSGSGSSGSNSGSGSSGSGSSGSGGSSDDSVDDSDDTFTADRDEQGFGDATFAIGYSLPDLWKTSLYLDLTGRVRLPTGKESAGLGNGATDLAAQFEFGWDGRGGGVYVGGGRRFPGNVDGALTQRRDTWQANAGFWRRLGPLSLVGLQGNWREASLESGTSVRSIDFYLTRRLGRGWRMEVSGGAGLDDANADYVAGLTFAWRSASRGR